MNIITVIVIILLFAICICTYLMCNNKCDDTHNILNVETDMNERPPYNRNIYKFENEKYVCIGNMSNFKHNSQRYKQLHPHEYCERNGKLARDGIYIIDNELFNVNDGDVYTTTQSHGLYYHGHISELIPNPDNDKIVVNEKRYNYIESRKINNGITFYTIFFKFA